MKKLLWVVSVVLTGCATVRQSDLDAWVGAPVAALDGHSIFVTMPMHKTITDDGTEVRVYSNTAMNESCFGGASSYGKRNASSAGWANCVTETRGCYNVFYIKDRKVLEYAPRGACYTNDTARPEKRFMRAP